MGKRLLQQFPKPSNDPELVEGGQRFALFVDPRLGGDGMVTTTTTTTATPTGITTDADDGLSTTLVTSPHRS